MKRSNPKRTLSERQKQEKERQLGVLMEWVSERIATKSDVPRVSDVVRHAYTVLGFRNLKSGDIARRLRLHPAYLMSSSQTRGKSRWRRYRPIVSNTLGLLHGDIGFFSVRREYETPATFRAGFLVLRDVVSRFTYATILRRNRKADEMVRAFQRIFQQHNEAFGVGPGSYRIKSISFDKETSVMSKKVQDFLSHNNVAFHAFQYSSSKSKFAEGAIRIIRTKMARLTAVYPEARWWNLLQGVVDSLNDQLLVIRGKQLKWRPREVNAQTLDQFREDLFKADRAQFFAQFGISPQLVSFKYPVGSVVRPKLIVTSSAVVGEKRSETSLVRDPFVVTEQLAYVNARFEVGRAYRCVNRSTREEEIFDEHDLAESSATTASSALEEDPAHKLRLD